MAAQTLAPGFAHDFNHVRAHSNPGLVQRQVAPAPPRSAFDEQPADLRSVLEASVATAELSCPGQTDASSCFNRWDSGARLTLRSLYNRLSQLTLWQPHILSVRNVWTAGVGGAEFTVKDHRKLFADLLAGGRFCVDTAAGGMLHAGTSLREVSATDSLHLSLDARNGLSVHIDAISPVAAREAGGLCRYDPTRAAAHIGREAIPDVLARRSGVELLRGLELFPEPRRPGGPLEREPPAPEFIRFGIRF